MKIGKHQGGFSIIGALVAVVILGTLVTTASYQHKIKLEAARFSQKLASRDAFRDNLNHFLASGSVILSMNTIDSTLKDCLVNKNCLATTDKEVSFVSPWGLQISPANYDDFYITCDSPSTSCKSSLSITLTIKCPNNAPACLVPSEIYFRWSLKNTVSNSTLTNIVYMKKFSCQAGFALAGITPEGEYKCIENKAPKGIQGPKGIDLIDWAGDPFTEQNIRKAMVKNCGQDYFDYGNDDNCQLGKQNEHANEYWSSKGLADSGGVPWYAYGALRKKIHFLCEGAAPNGDLWSAPIRAFDFSKQGCPEVPTSVATRNWPCMPGCFIGSTGILMANGEIKEAQNIQPGDWLWNPIKEERSLVVTIIKGPEYEPLVKITSNTQVLVVTSKHPILTLDKDKIVAAKDLRVLDTIFLSNMVAERVMSIDLIEEPNLPQVYNFMLSGKDFDDHFLLANGIITGDLYLQQQLEHLSDQRGDNE